MTPNQTECRGYSPDGAEVGERVAEIYGTLILGSEDRNAESLGVFVAWLVCNHLISDLIERSHGRAIARVRMHDLTGPEFLTTVLHGELRSDQLTETGRDFTERFLVSGDFAGVYESCTFDGDDEWSRYDEIAPAITAAYRRWRETVAKPEKRGGTSARIIKFPGTR